MNYGIVLRNTYPELETSTAKRFFELVDMYYSQYKPPGGGRNMQKLAQRFTNGSEVRFLHSGSEDLFQGPEIGWFLVDQAESVPERIGEKLTERLRRPGFPQQGMYVGNTNYGKNWCYRWFVRKERHNSSYHPITILDNIENLDKMYVEDLMRRPESWKKIWLYGSWDAPGGQVFAFTNEHFVDYQDVPDEWNKVIAVDPADGMGYCGALAGAVDFQGNIWIMKEYLAKEKHVAEHAMAIRSMWRGKHSIVYMDPSAWRNQSVVGSTGKDQWVTLADRYRAYELYPVPAENAIQPTIDIVHDYMDIDPAVIHPVLKRPGAPRIYISRSCVKLIEQNTQYTWESLDAKEIHLVDALRYLVASRPAPPARWKMGARQRKDDYYRNRERESLAWMAQ